MPNYQGLIVDCDLNYTRPDLLEKWAKKNDGLFFNAKLTILGKVKDPKTAQELGYYWGLLVPEICKELNRQGHTITICFNKLTKEVPYDKYTTHELLTELCGYVGEDGEHQRLSIDDKYDAVRYIDNVLDFAVIDLGMNEENLKAWRMDKDG